MDEDETGQDKDEAGQIVLNDMLKFQLLAAYRTAKKCDNTTVVYLLEVALLDLEIDPLVNTLVPIN